MRKSFLQPRINTVNPARNCRRLALLPCLLTGLLLAGCSSQELYQSIQVNRQHECLSRPIPERAQCEAQYQLSYDEYQKELERLELERIKAEHDQ